VAPLSSHSYSRGQASRAVVVGAGVIGLAVARELAREGWCVVVLERTAPGSEASSAAAGMLAPHGEFVGDSPLFRAGLESRAMYPSFVAELEDETGIDVDLRRSKQPPPAQRPSSRAVA
jgi:glycine oxidase